MTATNGVINENLTQPNWTELNRTEPNRIESTAELTPFWINIFENDEKDNDDNGNSVDEHFGEWHAIWERLCKILFANIDIDIRSFLFHRVYVVYIIFIVLHYMRLHGDVCVWTAIFIYRQMKKITAI